MDGKCIAKPRPLLVGPVLPAFLAAALAVLSGCGTTRDKLATEQLLLSDAVDRSIARIDFSPLADERVYLDTQYIQPLKNRTSQVVNTEYIISSLRQQMMAAGCLLQDKAEDADYIVEARVGTLGTDGYDVNYGLPANNALNAAAMVFTPQTPLPPLPEISLARKSDDSAAAKIAVFAYHRATKRPVWQSGLSVTRSTAQGRWIFGAGPFQHGTIYDGTMFAGEKVDANPFNGFRKGRKRNMDVALREQAYRNMAIWDEELQRKGNGMTTPERGPVRLSEVPAASEPPAGDTR